ncbi:hypothetical protein [Actinoplanes solisilvae]|uniref:hypothetical protein n=1 Tax=Actinoplanes solisilvae TaxID=2486853 RepID=UPI000FD98F6D|nr:hypothetical protein [Actinoplanes solisilvae]
MTNMLPWVLVILLLSLLCAVTTHHLWLSRGGTSLQALGASGTAGAATFGIGITLLNTLN